MKRTNFVSRSLALLLAVVMVLGFIPVLPTVEAAEGKTPIVLDFMDFASRASKQTFWKGLRATSARGVKSLGMPYGTAPTTNYTKALKNLETWMLSNYDWSIPDLYSGQAGHYNHTNGGRRIYIDSYSGKYGFRLHTDYPGSTRNESKFTFNFSVPAGQGGIYGMSVESFDEALESAVTSCDGNDLGGATALFYLNGEQVWQEETFAAEEDSIVTRDYRRVELQEGENTLLIVIVGDRNGAEKAGRCAMNLRNITFGDPGPECKHENTTDIYQSNNNRTHCHVVKCDCGEKISEVDVRCEDSDDPDTLCDECGFDLFLREAPNRTFGKDSVVLNFMDFASKVPNEPWFYELVDTKIAGARQIGTMYGIAPTDKQVAAFTALEQYLDENYNWNIEDLTAGNPKYTHQYGGRYIFVDSIRDHFGIRFFTAIPGNTGSDIAKLKLTVDVKKAGWYDMDIETFDESTTSVIPHYIDVDSGGAVCDIYVNGVRVCDKYLFGASTDLVQTKRVYAVYLEQGENSIVFDVVTDRNGTTNNGRRCLNLRYIELIPVGPCKHTDPIETTVANEKDHTHTVTTVCTCRETLSMRTEPCVDVDSNKFCDICKQPLAMRGPSPYSFTENSVVLDFMQFAYDAVQQDWWYDLRTTTNATNVKHFGMPAGKIASEEIIRAHEAAQQFLEENYDWNIVDLTKGNPVLHSSSSGRQIYIDSVNNHYGIRFHSQYPGRGIDNSMLKLEFDVPEEKAGKHALDICAFNCPDGSWTAKSYEGFDGNGATVDIYLNGALVMDDYCFTAETDDIVEVLHLGIVDLLAGKNTLTFEIVGDLWNAKNAGRTSFMLQYVEFKALDGIATQTYQTQYLDLNAYYMSYGKSAAGFTAKVEDPWIASASMDSKGTLSVIGIKEGKTNILVYNDSKLHCTIPVTVTTFGGTLDALQGSPVKLDFVTTVDRAEEQSFWTGTAAVTTGGAFNAWLKEHAVWNISAAQSVTANGDDNTYGFAVKGTNTFTVDVPAAGLYNVTVDYLQGGGKLDVSVNGKAMYQGMDTAGEAASAKRSLGAVSLNKGSNTVTVKSNTPIYLSAITLTPMGSWQVEAGGCRYLNLNESYLSFDDILSAQTVSSSADTVKARFSADGTLILEGVSEGTAVVTVTDAGTTVCTLNVTVVKEGKLQEAALTLNGFSALTVQAGETAVGDLSAVTTQRTPMTEAYLRDAGSVYFKSSDPTIAKVDQATGDVTAVAEGSAVISAYVLFNGTSVNTSAVITVTDDTDLVSIDTKSPVDYVGINNILQLTVSGKKASGLAANMSKYPVTWTVNDNTVATVTDDGKLTGLKEGTVTVTATVGVQRVAVTDSMVISVVPNGDMAGDDVFYEFTWNYNIDFLEYTLDDHDIALNRELTTNEGKDLKINSRGIRYGSVVNGTTTAVDFRVRKDGWYVVEVRGNQDSDSVYANTFVDDAYTGGIELAKGGTNGARGGYNTVWLDAGVHTLKLVAQETGSMTLGGLRLFATTDPNDAEITLTAEKQQLIPGQDTELSLQVSGANGKAITLLHQSVAPDYTNYYTLASSNTSVLTVSGNTVIAVAEGTGNVVLTGEIAGKTVTKTLAITVKAGKIAEATLAAEHTTVKPDAAAFPLTVTAFDTKGTAINLPEGTKIAFSSGDETIAKVDAQGNVTVQGKEGSALITAKVDEGNHQMEASLWITATVGKTAPTVYTYEERAIAQENVLKYDWAWSEKEAAVVKADLYVEKLDILYEEILTPQIWPGNAQVTYQNDPNYMICPMCNTSLNIYNGYYPWIVDGINNPWKITCPHCGSDFPSNDFRSYYFSGLGEDGLFHEELADKQFLVNELYPEKGEGWGVDDGWGWKLGTRSSTGVENVYTFISHFIRKANYPIKSTNHFLEVLDYLGKAYLYTGDEKYGNAGAILVDRLADIYPTWDISDFPIMNYGDNDGNGGAGIQFGATSDGESARYYAKAADVFWPCMENQEVLDYIAEHASWKGLTAEDITPAYVRSNVEQNLLLQIWENLQKCDVSGNFGIPQSACAYTAVALDRLPETQEMLDWLFVDRQYGGNPMEGTNYATGGGLLTIIMNEVKRDGLGNEGSLSYNSLWMSQNLETYDALNGYERVPSANMWQYSKVITMYHTGARLMTTPTLGPNLHETAGTYQMGGFGADVKLMTTAFVNTGDRTIARALYAFNGNTTAGIHGDIFTKDPEHGIRSRIEEIVQIDGEWEMAKSDMMPHYGLAMLKEGPAKYIKGVNDDKYASYWLYYGDTKTDHAQREILNLDLAAFGLTLSGNMGYPLLVNSNPERLQWVENTVSNNTVVVNDRGQVRTEYSGFPLHFADDGYVKVMDADVPNAYEETDIYRRTVIAVDSGEGVHYAIDFFRILGGSEHVYSFHAASMTDPETTGVDLVEQPMGTYMGADVPFGDDPNLPTSTGGGNGSGYSWLRNVARDDDPDTVFSVDWPIKDFHNQLSTSNGIHLKLTMLSEEPMTEVATADGMPPQRPEAPEHLEYLLVRKSGTEGMDTLFTTVLEPYQFGSYIETAELADVGLISGTEKLDDRAAAVKVTLKSGRVDYIVYATNSECTYRIADLFDFKGFTGVVSYENGAVTYAWGNEAEQVGESVTGALPRVTGEILSFTDEFADHYEMTISMDQPVTAEQLLGQWIYVENDGQENAAYRVDGAKVNGGTAVIDLSYQTLIRGYVDKMDLDKGFIYNISVGDTYVMPLSAAFDQGQLFHHVSDTVVKTGAKLSAPVAVIASGAAYELEGAPAGMKLDAAGILIWAPVKAQAGRYPISVKALKDGKVLGEMSFVIYAVNYSGSSYTAEVCTHAKAVTYDDTIVCPACGTITRKSAEEVEKFDIAGSNMTLGNELKLNILVENEKLGDGDYTVKITHDGQTVEKALVPYNSSYAYAAYSVCAKQMSDVITAEVYKDGVAVSNVYTASVRTYAMNILNNGKLGVDVKTLVVDMLNYGAEAQKFFDYNASDLANAKLNNAQKALATDSVECKNYQTKGKNFYGSNLSLEDRIVLNLFFKNCEDGMTATISFTDYNGTAVSVDAELVQYKNDIYKVAVDEIVLADAFSPVTVKAFKDGAEVGSATDSVESYVARNTGSAINEAIMKFAFSAKEYLK